MTIKRCDASRRLPSNCICPEQQQIAIPDGVSLVGVGGSIPKCWCHQYAVLRLNIDSNHKRMDTKGIDWVSLVHASPTYRSDHMFWCSWCSDGGANEEQCFTAVNGNVAGCDVRREVVCLRGNVANLGKHKQPSEKQPGNTAEKEWRKEGVHSGQSRR